jgi:hypothetical protein
MAADFSVGNQFNPTLTRFPESAGVSDAITSPIQQQTPFPSMTPVGSGGLAGMAAQNSSGDQSKSNFKVRLVSILAMSQNGPQDIPQVVFEVTPTISESGSVEYTNIQPMHMPGGIQVYKFSQSRTFEISAHFVSRNTADALMNMRYLQTLRSWRMPFFGNSNTRFQPTNNSPVMSPDEQMKSATSRIQTGSSGNKGVNLLGAPPEVLYLYGYSNSGNDKRPQGMSGVNINRIPVVLTNLGISYPEDVDYIPVNISPNANTEPFPVKMDLTISLLESHSPLEFEQFSLESYKNGTLKHF